METSQEGATLSNIADGALETAFQEHLARFIECTHDAGHFEQDKDGTIVCKIACEIEFAYNIPTRQSSVGARTKFTEPKRLKTYRAAFITDGAVTIIPHKQADLFALRPAASTDEGAPTNG